MRRQTIIDIISSFLLLVFVYTAIRQLTDHNSFKALLSVSPFTEDYAGVASLAMPIAEGLVSILLFIPRTRNAGLYGSFALMSVFSIYLAWMLLFTPTLPCPCDGLLKSLFGLQSKLSHMLLGLLFAGLAMTGVVLQRKQLRKEKERELPPVVFT